MGEEIEIYAAKYTMVVVIWKTEYNNFCLYASLGAHFLLEILFPPIAFSKIECYTALVKVKESQSQKR